MFQTISHGKRRVLFAHWAVHWLQIEVIEFQILIFLGLGAELGKDQLQLITPQEDRSGSSLRAQTNPINAWRRLHSAICLDGYFETLSMQGVYELIVYL
jgi:hypothetical protein